MEHDILNEIITMTVGGLFQFSSHYSESPFYNPLGMKQPNQGMPLSTSLQQMKKKIVPEPEENYAKENRTHLKSIDPNSNSYKSQDAFGNKSRSVDNSFDRKSNTSNNNSLQLSSGSLKGKLEEPSSRPGSSHSYNNPQTTLQNMPPGNENISLDVWIRRDGPLKLQESLKKMNLDLTTLSRINLANMSVEDLSLEKKRVKNELKRYDSAFSATFKRLPNREEKEPMRPLYIYYKKLKQYMIKVGDRAHSSKNQQGQQKQSSTSNSTALNHNHVSSHQNHNNPSAHSAQEKKSTSSNNYYGTEKENKITSYYNPPAEKKLDSSFEYHMSKNNDSASYEPRYNNYFGSGANKQQPASKGHSSQNSIEQLKRELEDLKVERSKLRDRLHSYQVDFTKNNNRKIKYHKDILPVENEYKRYKDIKTQIGRLEDMTRFNH